MLSLDVVNLHVYAFIFVRSPQAYFAPRWPYEHLEKTVNLLLIGMNRWYILTFIGQRYRYLFGEFPSFDSGKRVFDGSFAAGTLSCFQSIHKNSFSDSAKGRRVTNRRNINTNMSMLQIVTLLLLLVCHQTVARIPLLCLDAAVLNDNSNGNSESVHRLDAIVEEDAKSYAYKHCLQIWIFFFPLG